MENSNIITYERIMSAMDSLDMEMGLGTIVSETFDAVVNYIQSEIAINGDSDDEDGHMAEVLRRISDKVYTLCEKGKAEVEMVEAYRRARTR